MKSEIRARLAAFKKVGAESDDRIFEELVFCLCTPQSSAKSCFSAVTRLQQSRLLFKGDETAIGDTLKGYVRFHNTKSRYILGARQAFSDHSGNLNIKAYLDHPDSIFLRNRLAENVKGLGYKESGHFLRNIGRGENLAILDRHILRNMARYHVIQQVPHTLTRKMYLHLEDRLRRFSCRTGIPMADLDLLFWYRETGEIFK